MPSIFYLYSAVVSRGGRNSIAPTSASPVRYAQAEKRHSKMTMNRERDYITL